MAQAGVTEHLVPLVKKAVMRLDEELDAQTTKYFAHEGEVIDERNVVDHTARQGAIDKTFVLADLLRPRADAPGGGGRPVTINLIWPGWSSPPPAAIDVESTEAQP